MIIFILLIDVYLYRLLGLFITINGTEKSNNKPDSSNTLEVKVGFVESLFFCLIPGRLYDKISSHDYIERSVRGRNCEERIVKNCNDCFVKVNDYLWRKFFNSRIHQTV